jgi:hypothetical protein
VESFFVSSIKFNLNSRRTLFNNLSSSSDKLPLVFSSITKSRSIDSLAASRFLSIFEEKTRGNLSEDEDKLLKSVLRELRLNFIEETKKDSTSEKNIDEKEEN